MLERAEPVLKAVTAGLVVLLAVQVAGIARRLNPLTRTTVPDVPTWSPPTVTNVPTAGGPAGARPGGPPGASPGAMPRGGRGMPGGPGGPGGPGVALTPEVQARVDGVVQSEVLGMVMRPPPMALLGIAGKDVFLRAPNGMSGLVREGAELGGVQIVRVGTNRVLVKENGEEKELTIFQGIGGESLLPKPKEETP